MFNDINTHHLSVISQKKMGKKQFFTWKLTLAPPADSPKMVTLSGSPPNERMFLCTQAMAACWSHRPKFPDEDQTFRSITAGI